ncbi:TM2 domain-containing protein [Colwellia sp. MSW7]|jgi:TM2 domain-containing membrane protein YozV|uniref:TM2 domain-containing protein n=1 Tax=Colwellia maritima TaxID=2912588 RepID=A0ABS9X4F5_9GAMM|nr:TM2 domain-containing protein [Colwellia maritima]MCI2285123.1 TM2 domain-containing protein [Colwellia maritima]
MKRVRSKEALRLEENQLRARVAALTVEQKRQYYTQELEQIKDPDTYAALNWFFVAGLHHFYLGKWPQGILNIILMAIGVGLCIISPCALYGMALIIFVFLIELPQLFNSENVISQYNNELIKKLLMQFEQND